MMKFTTRSRYGLRMMIEIAREARNSGLVQLPRIAKTTGLSKNYLEQLAMPLKKQGLLIGVSGKNGGYKLGRSAPEIKISEILQAVDGPIGLTDCVNNPEICMNSNFCEARAIWVILSGTLTEVLNRLTLQDLIDSTRFSQLKQEYKHFYLLDPERVVKDKMKGNLRNCMMKEIS